MTGKYYISTPIYYCNAQPHLGHLYSTLYADFLANYYSQMGKEVIFVTGSDQHGGKIAQAAAQAGLSLEAFIASQTAKFQQLWQIFGINFPSEQKGKRQNFFVETHHQAHQTFVKTKFMELKQKDELFYDDYWGWYCQRCESFKTRITNSQLAREQNKNSFSKERGEKQLRSDLPCPDCHSTDALFWLAEKNFFLKINQGEWIKLKSALTNWTQNHLTSHWLNTLPSKWKELQKMLPFSLTRSAKNLQWGIRVDNDQTIYVWFDALWSYISALPPALQTTFWTSPKVNNQQPSKTTIIHILGKEIVKFHLIFWPLLLNKFGYKLPDQFLIHGWLLNDDQKMSKSRGNGISWEEMISFSEANQLQQPQTGLKLFLASLMRPHEDVNFSKEKYLLFYQTFLVNRLGNLIHRVLSLVDQTKPDFTSLASLQKKFEKENSQWEKKYQTWLKNYHHFFENHALAQAFIQIFQFVDFANKTINEKEPWILKKTAPSYLVFLLYHWLLIIKLVAKQLVPFDLALACQIFRFFQPDFTPADLKQVTYDFVWPWKKISFNKKIEKLF